MDLAKAVILYMAGLCVLASGAVCWNNYSKADAVLKRGCERAEAQLNARPSNPFQAEYLFQTASDSARDYIGSKTIEGLPSSGRAESLQARIDTGLGRVGSIAH